MMHSVFAQMSRTCLDTFADSMRYTRGQTSVRIDGVFDENFQEVDPNTSAIVTSQHPALGVMLRDLPDGAALAGDIVEIDTRRYSVIEPRVDSEGMALLILHELTDRSSYSTLQSLR